MPGPAARRPTRRRPSRSAASKPIQRAAIEQTQVGGFGSGGSGEEGSGSESRGDGFGGSNTVYFQFAGVPREVAEQISARLDPLGFEVPGEERIKTAAGLHEVRYFFPEDRERAQALADATNAILGENGYKAEMEVRDVTDFRGQKPRPGTLELWLEPVRRG